MARSLGSGSSLTGRPGPESLAKSGLGIAGMGSRKLNTPGTGGFNRRFFGSSPRASHLAGLAPQTGNCFWFELYSLAGPSHRQSSSSLTCPITLRILTIDH
jgi:hypothetical protein